MKINSNNLFAITKLKSSTPITPGTRYYKYISKKILAKKNLLLKPVTFKFQYVYSKTALGQIALRGRSSACKKSYRDISLFNTYVLLVIFFHTFRNFYLIPTKYQEFGSIYYGGC